LASILILYLDTYFTFISYSIEPDSKCFVYSSIVLLFIHATLTNIRSNPLFFIFYLTKCSAF